jgi:hypothetical protein
MNSITGGNKKIRRAVENVWRRRRRRKVRGAPARRRKWVAAANKNSARRRRALFVPIRLLAQMQSRTKKTKINRRPWCKHVLTPVSTCLKVMRDLKFLYVKYYGNMQYSA